MWETLETIYEALVPNAPSWLAFLNLIFGIRFLKEAASVGVKLLCFPENFSYVSAKDGDSVKIAESLDGPIMQGYCSLAR